MKNIEKFVNSNVIPYICLIMYAIITIYRIIHHIPFIDEAHAWTLAESLPYFDMVNEVKNEGHLFLWQTILYPFAKLHLYPYAMQIINWCFCTVALILMWWKAPFKNFTKALITFSFPFLGCYSVVARCYSLGIMFLFLLAIFYDKKMKYPKTYAIFLIICANTSVMALIGASAFGFLFLLDLIKHNSLSKKDNILVSCILSFGLLLVLYQLLNMNYFVPITSNRTPHISIKLFRNVFVYNHLWVNLLLLGIFSVPIFRFLYTNKRALFFVSYTYFLLLAFTTAVYGGFFWHSYFFYIYLIVGLWISFFGENSDNIRIWAIIALSIIAGILIFHRPTVSERFFVYGPLKTKYFIKILENDEKLKSAQILQNDGLIRESIPYASNKDFDLKVHCCIPNISEHSLLTGDNKLCTVKRTIEQAKREPACIYSKVMGTNKDSYTYIDSVDYVTERTFYNIPANGYSIYFNKYKCYGRYCFWKIEVKDGKTN